MKKIMLSLILSTSLVPTLNAELYIDNVNAQSINKTEKNTVKKLKKEVILEKEKNQSLVELKSEVNIMPDYKIISIAKGVSKRQNEQVIDGFANNIHLDTAISQIVPSIFKVKFKAGVDKQKNVSWKGGRPWRSILADMSKDNFSAVVDWNAKVITIYPVNVK